MTSGQRADQILAFAKVLYVSGQATTDHVAAEIRLLGHKLGGLLLKPVSHRRHLPFAAIGFAAVVSMIPAVDVFRLTSGVLQIAGAAQVSSQLIGPTMTDGMAAIAILLAMSFGLAVPNLAINHLDGRRGRSQEG